MRKKLIERCQERVTSYLRLVYRVAKELGIGADETREKLQESEHVAPWHLWWKVNRRRQRQLTALRQMGGGWPETGQNDLTRAMVLYAPRVRQKLSKKQPGYDEKFKRRMRKVVRI